VSDQPASNPAASSARLWAIRIVVVTAFVLTVWLYGPRALAVMDQRIDQAAQSSPRVALDRVGFASQPQWMDRAQLVSVSAALAPWLGSEVPILADDALRKLREGLATVPWVEAAAVERVFPDKLKVSLSLRRPVLAVRDGEGKPLCLVDRTARMLPWVDTPLPVVHLFREGGRTTMPVAPGRITHEPRVRAAVGIALEWRDELAPKVRSCPTLLEVDTTNLGEKWMRGPSYPEVRVKLARSDGAGVVFAYDRPVDSPLSRVPVDTKAGVLKNVLEKHPKLDGLVAGDLRMARRWADYLQPRSAGVRDPNEPWTQPLPPPK
jgi:hypothetical protein